MPGWLGGFLSLRSAGLERQMAEFGHVPTADCEGHGL